jgi:aspartyl-tRNA(Asn)/glutamyl-tRNA(Gln) amidotransferase subunit A
MPAEYCGIVGLKPAYGLVSTAGVIPLSWSLDHIGPMTNTVTDAALILQATAGYDREDPASIDVPVPDYVSSSIELQLHPCELAFHLIISTKNLTPMFGRPWTPLVQF